jgi:hypothetical protein
VTKHRGTEMSDEITQRGFGLHKKDSLAWADKIAQRQGNPTIIIIGHHGEVITTHDPKLAAIIMEFDERD